MPVAQVRDVAARAGVSPATVSNALNHPSKVSSTTLERIRVAIHELGYVRNDAARQLRVGSSQAIGMVVLDVSNPFFTDVARGVEDEVSEHDRPLILANSDQDPAREATYLDLFEQQHMSGVLITPASHNLDRLLRLRDRGTTVVLVDRMGSAEEFSSISIDDRRGGRLAAEHLLGTGRHHIAFIGGPSTLDQITHRLASAREAVNAVDGARLSFLPTAAMNIAAGTDGARRLLEEPAASRPDAVFAANDLVALGVLQTLTLAGVRVPDDVAIIGYDDIEFAAAAATPLSSIRQPAREIGRAGARLLLAGLATQNQPAVQHLVLEPELIVRRSTTKA